MADVRTQRPSVHRWAQHIFGRNITREIVSHQRAAELTQDAPGMLARPAEGEVVEHRTLCLELRRALHPDVGLFGLAPARGQQRHRRLVDVDDFVAEDEFFERCTQRRQTNPADAQPLRHA